MCDDSDGCHPSTEGHKLYARSLAGKLLWVIKMLWNLWYIKNKLIGVFRNYFVGVKLVRIGYNKIKNGGYSWESYMKIFILEI